MMNDNQQLNVESIHNATKWQILEQHLFDK